MTFASEPDPRSGLPVGPKVEATPSARPARVRMEGRFVDVVPLETTHAAELYAGSHGEGTEGIWPYLFPEPFDSEGAFAEHIARSVKSEDPLFFSILDKRSGRALGHATYMRITPEHRMIEVGNILYTPAMQQTPGGTEAMYLMARYVFEQLGYRRYEWKCNALNAPSRRAAERYGFTFEGIFRAHMIVKGRNRDTAWYAMIDSEWPTRKAAFERWLAPNNFDDQGRQRMSLSALMADCLVGESSLNLRRATVGDLSALTALQRAAYAPNRDTLGVEPIPLLTDYGSILGRYEVWVAGGDAIEGALILDPHPDHLLIWSIATAPAQQGKGVGKALIAAAEARAKDLGLTKLRLYTGEKLTRQVRWYHRLGYAIERVEELDDRRLVHMIKTIS